MEPTHPHLDGKEVGLGWVLPFGSLLLCISFCPLAFPHFWHHYLGLVALFHVLALLIPMFVVFGPDVMLAEVLESLLHEYVPFLALIFSLFVVAGGIRVTKKVVLNGTPLHNTLILFFGTMIASWVGTTGASLLLIRPLIRSNQWRKYKVHVFIYFIFLVANIGGSLSPLGDPPLFLGFLKGVDFLWFTTNMIWPMGMMVVMALGCFIVMDCFLYYRYEDAVYKVAGGGEGGRLLARSDAGEESDDPVAMSRVGFIDGWRNVPLLIAIPLTILITGIWEHNGPYAYMIHHVSVDVEDLVRDIILYSIGVVSLLITPTLTRVKNGFSWFPIKEVAQLFFAIFITIIPAVSILSAGEAGDLAPIIRAVQADGVPNNMAFFWFTGSLSSFLDNAPTFLIFFNVAGGDADVLMTDLNNTLLAISCGAVFMGAMSYIGNAPNFMVKSIVEDQGIIMPSFVMYLVWSIVCLGPLLAIMSLVFFYE